MTALEHGGPAFTVPPPLTALNPPSPGSAPGTVRARLGERLSGVTILLAGVDVIALLAASAPLWHLSRWVVVLAALQIVSRSSARIYRRRLRLSYLDDVPRVLKATATGLGVGAPIVLLADGNMLLLPLWARSMVVFLLVSEIMRASVFQVARWARRRFGRGERTLVLGASLIGVELARNMIDHPDFGLRPVGFVDAHPQYPPAHLPLPLLGDNIAKVVAEHRVSTVLLAFTGTRDADLVDAAMEANRRGCSMLIVPRMYELYHDAADVERLRSYPLMRLNTDPTRRPAWFVKRAIDIVAATVGLLIVSPVLLAAALAVLMESGRPIIFRQERIGKDGVPFSIFKLRSLRPSLPGEEQTTWSIAGDSRVGPVGRILRRTSLDELPQLWNIVRGDMSLVGPRPERPGFVERFRSEHERYGARHRVPSGLTGLAQISGLRGNTSIADRARFDNYYIANWSLWLDLKILLLTVRELARKGEH